MTTHTHTTTALITGASGGLGAEFARIHASRGGDLILVARSEAKLHALKTKLVAQYHVQVWVIALDLSVPDNSLKIIEQLNANHLKVDYLINNAGYGDFGDFVDADWAKLQGMMQLNMITLVQLTHLLLPRFLERGSGGILNVASTAAFQPGPSMAVYFATKSFVLSFSEAIATELSGSGVTVTTLCPGPTETGFKETASLQGSGLFAKGRVAGAHDVVLFGYKAMLRGRRVVVYGFLNRMMSFVVGLVPRTWTTKVVQSILQKS